MFKALNKLPCSVKDLPILVACHHDADNAQRLSLAALQWLKLNNPFYKDIIIGSTLIADLPEDGIPSELLTVQDNVEDNEVQYAQDTEDNPTQNLLVHFCHFQWPNKLKTGLFVH